MSKAEFVAALRKTADQVEAHPDTRDAMAGAVPPWLKTSLTLLIDLLTKIVPLL